MEQIPFSNRATGGLRADVRRWRQTQNVIEWVLVAGVLLLATTGCVDRRKPITSDGQERPPVAAIAEISQAAPAELGETNLAKFSQLALDGDGQAAYAVLIHYEMAMLDRRNSEFWAQIAAENGHSQGMLSYASYLLDIPSAESCRRAGFWVKRATTIAAADEAGSIASLQDVIADKCSQVQ